ncbi:hypothetical protein SRB17_21860 [Streptomyces sp. RB17]|uniref:hypothetical protein n=1 Tax=Streptomyces sp. RB17 TaxID=2585197 RepID=UPI00129617E6|nr:hypothetical protein [Streptomyces sp. RB17]MQY34220.1 hypothetical protein [Streptomyces sp. RB17]
MTAQEEQALVRAIEGHLLLAAARQEGRTAAARTASRLGWLSDVQREALEREFQEEYLTLSRRSWGRTADRAEELRQAYETRYRALRQRLLACLLLGCSVLAAAGLLVVSAA